MAFRIGRGVRDSRGQEETWIHLFGFRRARISHEIRDTYYSSFDMSLYSPYVVSQIFH